MLELLKKLSSIDGVPSWEDDVRAFIRSEVAPYADEISEDVMGNLLVFKKGQVNCGKTIMLAAHMDEVGFLVKDITDEGFLRFTCAGGLDPKVVLACPVRIGKNKVKGVIGIKAVHLTKAEERTKLPPFDDMYIDIGATSREEAEALVTLGDQIAFDSDPVVFGDGCLKAKGIDDRVGCAVMIKLIQEGPAVDTWFVFTVQEETGLRGATVASYRIQPDIAVVLEGTTAADLAGVSGMRKACITGAGPVVPVIDGGTIYCRELWERAFAICERLGIPYQTKTLVAGGTDAGIISKNAGGAKVMAISAAVRYIHSGVSTMKICDLDNILLLAREFLKSFAAEH